MFFQKNISEKFNEIKFITNTFTVSVVSICILSLILTYTATFGYIFYHDIQETLISMAGLIILIIDINFLVAEKEKIEKLEEKFNMGHEKIEKSIEFNKTLTEFFCNISHDIKMPLNVIMSSIQVLREYSKIGMITKDMQDKYLKIMNQNCYRLLKLVNNLIDISKIESGFFRLDLSNNDIVSVAEEVTSSVVEYAKNKGVSLIFDTDVEEKIMAFDLDKVERIILNLLSNAIKFTNSGDEILVTVNDKGDRVMISVKDTGIGIPEDRLKSIFDRFTRGDKTTNRVREGSGIGLSLVKSLVELHNGNIRVYSENGKGSEFIVDLPVNILEDDSQKKNYEFNESHTEHINIEFSDIYF